MKRLLIGSLAAGSMLFASVGVAHANSSTPQAKPATVSLAVSAAPVGSKAHGSSWPNIPADPTGVSTGQLDLTFASPASTDQITAYAVDCTATTKTQAQGATPAGATIVLPHMVATYAVNPTTYTSADTDFTTSGYGAANTTRLRVGPYNLTGGFANSSPPFTCGVTAINAGGASLPGPKNLPASAGLAPLCSTSDTDPVGLEGALQGGGLPALLSLFGPGPAGNNSAPVQPTPTAPSFLGKQSATNYDAVVATVPGFGDAPFCTTGATYNPHLLSDQKVTVSPSVAQVVGGGVKFTALGINASVKSSVALSVTAGSTLLMAYDASNYVIPAGGCPTTAAVNCNTNTAAIEGANPLLPTTGPFGITLGYLLITDLKPHTVAPGAPIVSSVAAVTFKKTPTFNPASPGVSLTLVTAVSTIGIGAGPSVPVTVTAPGNFCKGATGGLTDCGDTNDTSPVAFAPAGLL